MHFRLAASPLLMLASLNFLKCALDTIWGWPKFFVRVFQASWFLSPSGRLRQLLIASLAFPTHCASRRVNLWESSVTWLLMWSRKLTANSAYSEGSPPNVISSIFGSEGPCLSASAIVDHGAMSAFGSECRACCTDCCLSCWIVCNKTCSREV